MGNAQDTKAKIIEEAAHLFNQQGYAGASMADIMAATGLKKGGIYNHFESKDALAIAAFDFAVQQVRRRYSQALKGKRGAIARLTAILQTFSTSFDDGNAPLKGGCPLLNTAIDSDDTHPALRERTRQAMEEWRLLLCYIVQQGIDQGELQPASNPEAIALIFIATLEGAMMLAKLYGDRQPLQHAQAHLEQYIAALRSPP